MAELSRDDLGVNARILYWGIQGAGKTTNLHAAFAKLRPDHRGTLRDVPTPLDPSVTYEVLPISLGDIAGVRTQIEMIAVPGGHEQAPTRKQLLDHVDGVVLVVDSQRERVNENIANFEELRHSLAAYGRSLDEIPVVVQYNKRDLTDAYALEDLHRKLELSGAPVFEAVATEGTGVLQTLSTISKRVIRSLREQSIPVPSPAAETTRAQPSAAVPEREERVLEPDPPLDPEPPAFDEPFDAQQLRSPSERMEQAILDEDDHPENEDIAATARQAEALLEEPWDQVPGEIERTSGAILSSDFSIVSVGEATRTGERAVRVPVVLGDAQGKTSTLVLTIQLDPMIEPTGR